MKKFAMILSVILTFMLSGSLSAASDVPFAIGEWAPYTGEAIDNHGMASEIVSAACKAVGLNAAFSFEPWKRAEHAVQSGNSFGTFPYKEMAERQTDFLFSDTLFSSSFVILAYARNSKTDGFQYGKDADFKDFSVGIVAGTSAIKNPLTALGVKVEEVTRAEQNLKKLKAGRIDFYIDDRSVVRQALKETFSEAEMADFTFLDKGFGDTNEFKIMVSKKYPDSAALLKQINDGIAKITASGEHAAILIKYGM